MQIIEKMRDTMQLNAQKPDPALGIIPDAVARRRLSRPGADRRLWRSLKYECVYLRAFETGSQAREGIGKWLAYHNAERPHSTHGILTPDEVHASKTEPTRMAA